MIGGVTLLYIYKKQIGVSDLLYVVHQGIFLLQLNIHTRSISNTNTLNTMDISK